MLPESSTRTIPLTHGDVALVDAEDYDTLITRRWGVAVSGGKRYARADIPRSQGRGVVYMHRLIMGSGDGESVYHINGDGLDNRRCNLRTIAPEHIVDERTGCWLWQRCRNEHGYGVRAVQSGSRLAHRINYVAKYGPIPHGAQLDHLCRTRSCVNPDHLEVVSALENLRRGAAAHICSAVAVRIRREVASGVSGGLSLNRACSQVAGMHGVSTLTVYSVATGRSWRDADGPITKARAYACRRRR
jgi:hypothetical protein